MADYDPHRALNERLNKHLKYGDVALASGTQSHVYVDVKSYAMTQLGHLDLGHRIEALLPDCVTHVAGMGLGAYPLVSATIMAAANYRVIDGLFIRKDQKTHGISSRIEGQAPVGANVILLEDVVTTGESAVEAIGLLTEAGYKVHGCIAVVQRRGDSFKGVRKLVAMTAALTALHDIEAAYRE